MVWSECGHKTCLAHSHGENLEGEGAWYTDPLPLLQLYLYDSIVVCLFLPLIILPFKFLYSPFFVYQLRFVDFMTHLPPKLFFDITSRLKEIKAVRRAHHVDMRTKEGVLG